ncbi:hypothetical protein ACFL03_12180 [Thermodesulfobacteriota bacterium]
MNQPSGDEPVGKQPQTAAQSKKKEQAPGLAVSQIHFLLDTGHQWRKNDPAEENQQKMWPITKREGRFFRNGWNWRTGGWVI